MATAENKKYKKSNNLEFVLLIGLWLFAFRSSSILVQLADDGLSLLFEILLLFVEFLNTGFLVAVQPADGGIDGFSQSRLVLVAQLSSELLLIINLVLERIGVGLQSVTSFDLEQKDEHNDMRLVCYLLLDLLVVIGVLLGVVDHALDVFWAQSVLVVGDGDLVLVSGSLIFGSYVKDSVDINFESDLQRHGRQK